MTTFEIIVLIISGIFVGFINTIAGGGTLISLSVLMFMGLPADVANGTNRIAVFFQTLTSSASFKMQKVLETKKGISLSIPMIIGSFLGSIIAVKLNENYVEKAFGVVMVLMLFFLFYKPEKWMHGNERLRSQKMGFWKFLIFFLIGVYGGFIHVGVGYFIMAGVIFNAGYDLVKANALKVFLVLMYVPFTLIVFIIAGQVNYKFGLIHAIGNILGAYLGARWAVSWGANFVKWVMIIIIFITSVHFLGVVNLKELIQSYK